MVTSVLMYFLITYFVQTSVGPEHLAAAIADRKRVRVEAALAREFEVEISRREVILTADVSLLRVTFGERVLFETGRYELGEPGRVILRRLASVIRGLANAGDQPRLYEQIQIEGHTDSRRLD